MKPALHFLNNPVKENERNSLVQTMYDKLLLYGQQVGNGQKDSFQSSLENLNVGFLYLI